MDLLQIVDRKHEIREMAQPASVVKQRIAKAAQELDRAGSAMLHVELASEALCKFVAMLYRRDVDGVWANIDPKTHRLLVPAPWGNAGWKRWGLRNWEACIMRRILLDRVSDAKRPCLFDYNAETRLWYLNVIDYPTLEAAEHYLKRGAITLAEWRKYDTQYKQGRNKVATR